MLVVFKSGRRKKKDRLIENLSKKENCLKEKVENKLC